MSVSISNYALAPHVHVCRIEDDLVFLDEQNDAYFCLPGAGDTAAASQGSRFLGIADTSLAAELLAAGMLSMEGAKRPEPRRVAAAARESRLPDQPEVLRLGDLPQMAWSLFDLLIHYRGRTFAQLMRSARAGASRPRRAPRRSRDEVLKRFHRWAPYAPVPAKCLLRSFMLLRLLRRHGYDAAWVIGVTTWPFAAHCWLQVDAEILDEACERAALFHPILVV